MMKIPLFAHSPTRWSYHPYFYPPRPQPEYTPRNQINSSIPCDKGEIPHYLNLHIPPTSSYGQVAQAYRAHILALHPDKLRAYYRRLSLGNKDEGNQKRIDEKDMEARIAAATKAYQLVRSAWEILGSSEGRKNYTFFNYHLFVDLEYQKEKEGEKKEWQKKTGENEKYILKMLEDEKVKYECEDWVIGHERPGHWKCWELSLWKMEPNPRADEWNRRRAIWEGDGSPLKTLDLLQEGVGELSARDIIAYTYLQHEDERKPWFWNYPIIPRHERYQATCAVGWVNAAHLVIDNLLPDRLSDEIWNMAENIRLGATGRKKELVEKKWQFWEGCSAFEVDVRLWEDKTMGIGKGKGDERWSMRRSDTRFETLGRNGFCLDSALSLVLVPILIMVGVIYKLYIVGWWLIERLVKRWMKVVGDFILKRRGIGGNGGIKKKVEKAMLKINGDESESESEVESRELIVSEVRVNNDSQSESDA